MGRILITSSILILVTLSLTFLFNLDKDSYIIDVGSNDGIGLKPFLDMGYKNIQGIEPAKNLAELANKNGATKELPPRV